MSCQRLSSGESYPSAEMQSVYSTAPQTNWGVSHLFTHSYITVLLQTIHFNVSTQFSPVRPIDGTLSGALILGQSGLTIRLFRVILRTLVGGVYSICRDVVGVFYSPSWLGQSKFLRRSVIILEYSDYCLHLHCYIVSQVIQINRLRRLVERGV